MEKIATEVYPEVSLIQQVKGVGTQIALTTERGPVRLQVVPQIVAMVAHVQRHTMISLVGLLVPQRLRHQ